MSAPVFHNVLDSIGNTPLIEVVRMDAGPCRLFLKLENQNPGGSIKDRIGLSMIAAAERDGSLAPGGAIVEATAGNTGHVHEIVDALKAGGFPARVLSARSSEDQVPGGS